jgi:Carboxypeptidase regulatory-like domain
MRISPRLPPPFSLGLALLLTATSAPIRPAHARPGSTNQSAKGLGTIEGRVVTREGKPVSSATVYAFEYGRSPMATTDGQGGFTLRNLPAGNHAIFAYKESDGFPNLLWSFYGEAYAKEAFPVVNVGENQVVRDVIIRLGPQAGRLLIRVIDARTRQPIKDASITLNHKGKPRTLFEPGGTTTAGEFDILVPPSVPINVVVKAPGYRTWIYLDERSDDRDAIRLPPASSKKISVELEQLTR